MALSPFVFFPGIFLLIYPRVQEEAGGNAQDLFVLSRGLAALALRLFRMASARRSQDRPISLLAAPLIKALGQDSEIRTEDESIPPAMIHRWDTGIPPPTSLRR